MKIRIILVVVILATSMILFGQSKCPPRNELYKDSSLTDFVCKLQYAIFKKNKDFLLSVVDKNVKNGFGGDNGIEAFKEMWKLDSSDSDIWYFLSRVISLGGTFCDTPSLSCFVLPYVGLIECLDTLNPYSTMVVTETNVNVREKPDKNSNIIGQLNYDIVMYDYDKSYFEYEYNEEGIRSNNEQYYMDKEWYYISSLDKKIGGYVSGEYLWSPIGYRFFLDKIDGNWKIIGWFAGD